MGISWDLKQIGGIKLSLSRRRISDAVGLYAHKHKLMAKDVRRTDSLREAAIQEYEQYEKDIHDLKFYKVTEGEGMFLANLVCACVGWISSTKVWFCEPFDHAKEGEDFIYTDSFGQPLLEGTGWTLSLADAMDEFYILSSQTFQGRQLARQPVHVSDQ